MQTQVNIKKKKEPIWNVTFWLLSRNLHPSPTWCPPLTFFQDLQSTFFPPRSHKLVKVAETLDVYSTLTTTFFSFLRASSLPHPTSLWPCIFIAISHYGKMARNKCTGEWFTFVGDISLYGKWNLLAHGADAWIVGPEQHYLSSLPGLVGKSSLRWILWFYMEVGFKWRNKWLLIMKLFASSIVA